MVPKKYRFRFKFLKLTPKTSIKLRKNIKITYHFKYYEKLSY